VIKQFPGKTVSNFQKKQVLRNLRSIVTPAKAGVQSSGAAMDSLDSGFRRNDCGKEQVGRLKRSGADAL